ncbi:helicase-associated domain-containing protein [Corynebacterium lizhenjunii]|uniref:helicase-associated domain-containing protein n=1 Tax=Corynebacterium lizhenjunii TaxID=2709394 RepID=UPI0013EB667D|nr:helicase-associated domain-containing protein [Corynebacterium lizhenjunii]
MSTASKSTPAAADFRDWLEKRSDAELCTILQHRPDVVMPLPPSFAPLATRLTLRASVTAALATCTAGQLLVLEHLAQAGAELSPVKPDVVPHELRAHLPGLQARALIYGTAHLAIPTGVMAALPADWSLMEQTPVPAATIEDLPADQRRVLNTLAQTGLGTTRDAAPDADPTRPIPQLLAAGLIQRVDSSTVRLPRATRLALRGTPVEPVPTEASGRIVLSSTGDLPAGPPTATADQAANEQAAAAGLDVVRLMGRLLDLLGRRPVPLLKDKTVGVRHLAQLNKELDTQHAARLVSLAHHARLVARGEPAGGAEGNFLAPTEAASEFADAPLAHRLEHLVQAWLGSPWAAWESSRGLDPETRHEYVPRHREHILRVYQHARQPLSDKEFAADLRYLFPLFATHTQPETIAALREEAEWLGVIAAGHWVWQRPVPNAVDTFIMQADMTVITPGPLETPVLHTLEQLADLESPGLASVYRVSAASLRRGMDAGLTPEAIGSFFARHAYGEVPQAVSFLIEDVARSHGMLRAGTALCYVRCEDTALLAHAVAAVEELRLLAPTVAIAESPLGRILEQLRAAGFAPAAEDATGASIDVRPAPAVLPTPRPAPARPQLADATAIRRAVATLRGSGASASTSEGNTPAGPDVDLIAAAVRSKRPIIIGYADKNGRDRQLQVTPLSMAGGQVDAIDGAQQPVRFPVHRITSVHLA